MSAREFAEWMAYYQLEPFGEERADLRAAIVAKTIADVNTPKGARRAKLTEFMPRFEREEQTVEQQISIAAMLTAAFGGKDERHGDESHDNARQAGH